MDKEFAETQLKGQCLSAMDKYPYPGKTAESTRYYFHDNVLLSRKRE